MKPEQGAAKRRARSAFALSIFGLLIATAVMFGQPAARRLEFDVASVKPTPPEVQNRLRTDYCRSDGSFGVSGTPVLWSLQQAFDLRDYQIAGAPPWITGFDTTYAIEAKPARPVNRAECRLMLQALFAARFKLATHRESKETAVYFLRPAKGGAKITVGGLVQLNGGMEVGDSGQPRWPNGLSMDALARILSGWAGRPVVDQTGLAGTYGITLDFSRSDDDGKPSLFTAVQEQLGLKLESGKAPIEVLVIDHIEKPDAN